jgi:CDGSH-type Zn-finger protein
MSDADEKVSPEATLPRKAQDGPYEVRVEEGRTYRWCSCGLSATQPWCDESHAGTGFEPIEFVAPISGMFFMCGCKGSENAPFCFGTCRGYTRKRGDGPVI